MRGQEQIIVFNLANAAPAMYIAEDGTDGAAKKRVSLCPEEWDDGFGEEFYEHNLENGFFYLTPNTSWNSQAESILAPGMEQFAGTSPEQLQMAIEDLKGGFNENGNQ